MTNEQTQIDLQHYLTKLFTEYEPYTLSAEDQKLVARDLQTFIVQKLLRKKFRKQKVYPNLLEDITKRVAGTIKENKPLHVTIFFGEYKHFWNASHPEPDWAEIFALKFFTDWVSPILAVHKPGVILEFISEDMILPRMNNYPEETLEKYAQAFTSLLETYKQYVPENLRIQSFRVGDKHDKQAIIAEVEKLLPERLAKLENSSPEEKEIEIKRSKRSVMWKGKEDLTGLSEAEKQKKIMESRVIELTYYEVEARPEFLGDYAVAKDRISILFSFGLSPDNIDHFLTIGSTYASLVDFWIGRGILEYSEKGFTPRIVSKEQYNKIKNDLETYPINIPMLSLKNWQTIEVIKKDRWGELVNPR